MASGGGIVEAAGTTNVTAGAGGKAVRAGGGSSVSLQEWQTERRCGSR